MLQLNYRDSRPIYEQVRDGLRRLIITGAIPAGDKLPSVRQLAASLAINPNTIQRSYEALEQEGYAYSVPGKGSFVALPVDVNAGRRKELLTMLDGIVQELLYLGIAPEEITARCGGKKPGADGGTVKAPDPEPSLEEDSWSWPGSTGTNSSKGKETGANRSPADGR